MKNTIILFLAAAAAISCTSPMPRGDWSKIPYKALCQLMKDCKAEADDAGRNVNYAIFDYDNTTILQDVELSTMKWQIENFRFNFTPEEVPGLFLSHIPDPDTILTGAGAAGVTSRMLVADFASDYAAMMKTAGVSCGNELTAEQIKKLHSMDEYLDYRVKVWGLYEGLFFTFGYDRALATVMALYHKMTYPEVDALIKEGVRAQIAKKCLKNELWESPDMGEAGKVSYMVPDGLALSREMRRLYKSLPENGIDVYVFSASMEAIVEAMACDPEFLGLDTAQVFAIRMKRDSTDFILQEYQQGYIQPYKKGKSDAIREYIAPRYDGRGPVLVGGDSNGDYSMLTSFPDMRVGLIIDKNQQESGIGDLRRQALDAENGGAPSRYVLQRRGDPQPRFRRRAASSR